MNYKERINEKEKLKKDAFDLYYNSERSAREIAAIFHVSTRTLQRWINEVKNQTPASQQVPGRKRLRQHKYPGHVFDRIVELKKENPGRPAPLIHRMLKEEYKDSCPSVHLVRKYIFNKGLSWKNPALSRKGYVKFEREMPNDLWQVDIAGVQTAGHLGRVYLFALLDDCSRFVVSARYFRDQKGINVVQILRDAFEEYGRPRQILADNGAVFRNVIGELGTRYSRLLAMLEVEPIFARPYHPQTKGKLERWFGTVKNSFISEERFFIDKHPETTFKTFNQHFSKWLHWYDFEKPHRSLPHRCSPANVYFKHPKRIYRPLETNVDWERWLVITGKRKVSKYNTVSYKKEVIQVPEGHAGCRVEVFEIDNRLEVYHEEKCLATHVMNPDHTRLQNKKFTRQVSKNGTFKYKRQEYWLDRALSGKRVVVKETCNGSRIAVFLDDVLYSEFEIKRRKEGE